jgi:hypothetical protein
LPLGSEGPAKVHNFRTHRDRIFPIKGKRHQDRVPGAIHVEAGFSGSIGSFLGLTKRWRDIGSTTLRRALAAIEGMHPTSSTFVARTHASAACIAVKIDRSCPSWVVITGHHAVLRPCLLCPRKQALLPAMWAERKQAGRKEGQVSDCRRRACQVRQGITADERSSAVHAGLKLRNT